MHGSSDFERDTSKKKWGCCPKKRDARQETVINMYRSWSGKKVLPIDQYYWTLGSACGENGKVIVGSEFDHVVIKEKMIVPRQWICVEHKKTAAAGNATLENTEGGLWLDGEFLNYFRERWRRLPPGLINLDVTNCFAKGFNILGEVLLTMSKYRSPCMVVLNAVRQQRYYRHPRMTNEEFSKNCKECRSFQAAQRQQEWQSPKEMYGYPGTGKGSTEMNTMWLFNRPAFSRESKT